MKPPIPRHQIGTYKCECGDSVFEAVQSVKFNFDKLDPNGDMTPSPVPMFRCLGCNGFLTKGDGKWVTVHPAKKGGIRDGDEWKKL